MDTCNGWAIPSGSGVTPKLAGIALLPETAFSADWLLATTGRAVTSAATEAADPVGVELSDCHWK